MDGSASIVGFGSVLAGYFEIPYMDSIGSIIIAVYIFFMAYVAPKESTSVLVDSVNKWFFNCHYYKTKKK